MAKQTLQTIEKRLDALEQKLLEHVQLQHQILDLIGKITECYKAIRDGRL